MSQTPKLKDIIEAALDQRAEDTYTAVPGKIKSYDPATSLANVQVLINNPHDNPDGSSVTLYPTLTAVPVMFPGSGKYRMTFPVGAGDTVLLIISTFPLGNWLKTGAPTSDLSEVVNKNSLGSGFAIPGLFPSLKVKPPTAAGALDEVIIHTDGATVRIGADATELLALKSDLAALRSALTSATISTGPGGAESVVIAADAITAPSEWPVGTTKTRAK